MKVWRVFVRGRAYERGTVVTCNQNLEGVGNPDLYYAQQLPVIDGVKVDYFPVAGGDLVCSARMRATIDKVAVPNDAIRWAHVTLLVRDQRPISLWRLEFSLVADVLDEARSIFDQYGEVRMLRKPVFAASKCERHSVFADRPNCRHAFCVTNASRRELAKLEPRK